jgi:hypothetical protein
MGRVEEEIIRAINGVLREVFGDVVMSAIKERLLEEGLDLEDPSMDIKKFREFMMSLFGKGAETLEKTILDNLYSSLDLPVPEGLNLLEAIERLKEELSDNSTNPH